MYKRLSDKLLMQKVQEDDQSAITELYRRFHSYVVGYFRKSYLDADISNELAQVVFEKVLKYKATYKAEAKLKTWLYAICRNVKIDYLNSRKSEAIKLENYRINLETEQTGGSSFDLEGELNVLRQALLKLEEPEQEIITLGKLENLNYSEIAELLGITESNVKVRMFRAMKSLKREFDLLSKKRNL